MKSENKKTETLQIGKVVAELDNQIWRMDFMSDSLWNGRKIRLLNIIDDYNREILNIETYASLPTERVIRVLENIGNSRGFPKMIKVDN